MFIHMFIPYLVLLTFRLLIYNVIVYIVYIVYFVVVVCLFFCLLKDLIKIII